MDLACRMATPGDVAFILDLEELCMREYAEALWGSWRPSATIDTLSVAGHELVTNAGMPVGCIATSWRPDHLWIDKLYVRPMAQNRGIGAWALRLCVVKAVQRGVAARLSVLTTNRAKSFYLREGFTVESVTAERVTMIRPPHAALW